MTSGSDIERLLDNWLSDGPDRVADRVVDDVALRIARQPQRAAWRLRPWRFLTMPMSSRVLVLAGALIATLVAGGVFFGTGGQPAIAPPSPHPTATPTPPPAAIREGSLAPGTYRFRPFDAAPGVTIDATVPTGWSGIPKWALIGPRGTEAPAGIGIAFLAPAGVFSDPCHWDRAGNGRWPQAGDVATGGTIDELVAALRRNAHYTAGPARDVVLGGHAGKRVDLQLPADVDFAAECDSVGTGGGSFFLWGTAERDGSDLFAQGRGQRWQVSILEAGGTRFVVVVDDFAGTSEADRAAGAAIVDSIVITP